EARHSSGNHRGCLSLLWRCIICESWSSQSEFYDRSSATNVHWHCSYLHPFLSLPCYISYLMVKHINRKSDWWIYQNPFSNKWIKKVRISKPIMLKKRLTKI